ncbi:MAG: hypothetical protein R3320_15190, partial [Nitriliruptorales bacterium]|nr:hypothetical protein [Nitriliruptorales bacterium]
RTALFSAAALLIATATWPMSGRIMLPHAPSQLAIAVFLLGLSRGRLGVAGLGAGFGILVRPLIAVVPAVAGRYLAWRRGSLRPALLIGAGAGVGLSLLLLYNNALFGGWSVSGGYSDAFSSRLTDRSTWVHLSTFVELLASPRHGVFFWTPVLFLLVPGSRAAWRNTPNWARASAIAGLLYLFIHAGLNRASGGLPFNYRYQLETLTLLLPLLTGAYFAWTCKRQIRIRLFTVALALSVTLQAMTVFGTRCVEVAGETRCGLWFSVSEQAAPTTGLSSPERRGPGHLAPGP